MQDESAQEVVGERAAMTDVIKLAKGHRARLMAECAKLNDFLRVATELVETGDGDGLRRHADARVFDAGADQEAELVLTDALPQDDALLDIYVGKMIRHRRWMMGMTQEQLSELLGLSVERIQDYETGVRHASSSVLRNIATEMKVPVSFFLQEFGEEGPGGDEFFDELLTEN